MIVCCSEQLKWNRQSALKLATMTTKCHELKDCMSCFLREKKEGREAGRNGRKEERKRGREGGRVTTKLRALMERSDAGS